jgi:hypothetical protein
LRTIRNVNEKPVKTILTISKQKEEQRVLTRLNGQRTARTLPFLGYLKLVLLDPGDTPVMRPGYQSAHAVVTLDSSIIVGGMLWPNSNLSQLTASLGYVLQDGKTTNEHVQHLPEYIEAAISMGDRQAGDHIPGSHRIPSRLRFVAKKWGTPQQPLRVVLGEAIN